jgi:hypothetical protein
MRLPLYLVREIAHFPRQRILSVGQVYSGGMGSHAVALETSLKTAEVQ